MSSTLIHFANRSGQALCGGLHARLLDRQPERVTCRVCVGLLRVEGALHGLVDQVREAITARLVEVQRDPGAQALGGMVRMLIDIDRSTREEQRARRS